MCDASQKVFKLKEEYSMDYMDLDKYPAEPYKIKAVEVVKMISREERASNQSFKSYEVSYL